MVEDKGPNPDLLNANRKLPAELILLMYKNEKDSNSTPPLSGCQPTELPAPMQEKHYI